MAPIFLRPARVPEPGPPEGDNAMARWHAVVLGTVTAAALAVGGAPPAVADEVWLRNGGMLRGDLDLGELVLEAPTGSYRVTRERAWRLDFDTGPSDDSVHLRNGSRISGRLDRGPVLEEQAWVQSISHVCLLLFAAAGPGGWGEDPIWSGGGL